MQVCYFRPIKCVAGFVTDCTHQTTMKQLHDTEGGERDNCTIPIRSLNFQNPNLRDCIFQGQINQMENDDVFEHNRTTVWKPLILVSEKNILSGSFAFHVARSGRSRCWSIGVQHLSTIPIRTLKVEIEIYNSQRPGETILKHASKPIPGNMRNRTLEL